LIHLRRSEAAAKHIITLCRQIWAKSVDKWIQSEPFFAKISPSFSWMSPLHFTFEFEFGLRLQASPKKAQDRGIARLILPTHALLTYKGRDLVRSQWEKIVPARE